MTINQLIEEFSKVPSYLKDLPIEEEIEVLYINSFDGKPRIKLTKQPVGGSACDESDEDE